MHPGRTGRSALKLAADLAGVARSEVDMALRRVGLYGKAADRRVGAYSLGMRQRLGIAQALIARPQVLVLDEPANGLDPEGIAWMRRLLRDFADEGGTVLLSSHLLSEVQATVDRLVVISGGRIVAAGALDELLVSRGLVVRSTDGARVRRMLEKAAIGYVDQGAGGVLVDPTDGVDSESIARLAMKHGVVLVELRASDRTGLEQLFFDLTAQSHQEVTA